MLLTDLLRGNIEKYDKYPLLYFEGEEITNVDIEKISLQFASFLRSYNVKKGDRVIVCMPNRPEVIYAYQGVMQTGAIVIPVMHLLHENEINYILEHSGATIVITSGELVPKMEKATVGLPQAVTIVSVDNIETTPAQETKATIVEWSKDMTVENDPGQEELNLVKDDVAVILYTSGTTGKPKGVMLTHKNLTANMLAGLKLNPVDNRGTTLAVLPLAHAYGFGVMNGSFFRGNAAVIFSRFDVDEVFRAIERYKVKTFSAVPAMIHAMVSSPNSSQYDLSSLEAVGSGSAALPISLREAFQEKFQAEVRDAYGLSEASPGVATQREDKPIKEGSVGLPLPGVEIKIVDEEGRELPVGEAGELIVKGDNITPGYYKDEEATKEALKDGWLYTGDIAKVDEDGYLYIIDRKKDLIIRGGFNIYPRDLEELILRQGGVSEVAVIGVPSEEMGEEVVAFVVKKENATIEEADLIEYCQKNLAKYKTPKQFIFVSQLPRNGVGKILKTKLREMYPVN